MAAATTKEPTVALRALTKDMGAVGTCWLSAAAPPAHQGVNQSVSQHNPQQGDGNLIEPFQPGETEAGGQ